MTNKPQALDEQMIADMARAMEPVAWERLGTDRDRLKYEYARSTTLGYARAAHSLIAAKVAELEEVLEAIGSGEAFRVLRFAEDDDPEYFLRAQRHVQQIARAALAPEPTDYCGIIQPSHPEGTDQ